ncbi:hypothetical protein R1sor_014477 [Riccia sorocarpa]|uniref:Selenoprotein H n=1 Tax=Riccia sorocarpa TaxID=122646 RepID=A0ABD3H9R7_9MARC
MPPKRKAAPKKKSPSPSASESEVESEVESEEDPGSESEPESPKPKKSKAPAKTRAAAKTKAAPAKTKAAPKAAPKATKPAPAKKGTAANKETKKVPAIQEDDDDDEPVPPAATPEKKVASKNGTTHLIIEHCKQCQSFRQRALKIQELVKKSVPDVDIEINPEKPRRGCFEIREAGPDGRIFLSLQNLVRPFPKLKALNLEETAEEVITQIT